MLEREKAVISNDYSLRPSLLTVVDNVRTKLIKQLSGKIDIDNIIVVVSYCMYGNKTLYIQGLT